MSWAQVGRGRTFIVKLDYGTDFLDSITGISKKLDISSGYFTALGAVQKAAFYYYDQVKKKYIPHTMNRRMEIAACIGNVSVLEGQSFVHAHVVFSDSAGKAYGGHLMKGAVIFSCELPLDEVDGVVIGRTFDPQTGLNLLSLK